ncbi:MAG TPA: LacI family DNA-binding transcriptional regulator [Anaerolineales bacterium]|nr:LacI family DNA-binding transcriptional regulator [Anaerolineales bacterium]
MTRRQDSVTIREVAKKAGVSVATVSRYTNSSAPVSPEVAERLAQVMSELHYMPHAAARQLATRKTRAVGLLLNNLRNDFFVPFLNGVEDVVRKKGYNLIIATYLADSREETPPPIGPHNTDGMLVFSDGLGDEALASYHATGFPMVLVHSTPPASLSIPSVTVENIEITRQLIEHLIRVHGRQRIVFLRGPKGQEDSFLRERGYRQALEANGLEYDKRLIHTGGFERGIAYDAINTILSNGNRTQFDAVFAGSDDAAIGVFRALQQHGVRIPEDVSVAGFDNLGFGRFLDPPLTTVSAPTETVARMATERLFGLLDNQPSEGAVVLPTELILRRSCGCQFEQPAL